MNIEKSETNRGKDIEMTAGKVYEMAKAVAEIEKIMWKSEILSSMGIESGMGLGLPFEVLVLIVYSYFDKSYYIPNLKVIAYGAGKMARKYIPHMKEKIGIYEIWDAYSDEKSISDISIVRPKKQEKDFNIPLVIFIDDRIARCNVIDFYRKKGYENIFYFRDYLELLEEFCVYEKFDKCITTKTKDVVDRFCRQYEMIEGAYFPVLFPVLNKKLKENRIQTKQQDLNETILKERLSKIITVDRISEDSWSEVIDLFFYKKLENKFQLAYSLEAVLEKLLSNGTKTLYRPIRMADDRLYDEFAITSVVNELLIYLLQDYDTILEIIHSFRSLAENSIPLMASEGYFMIKCGKHEDALGVARKAMKKEPNNLLANEIFYQAARVCKENGVYVEEPIPEYDLSERFCWSGLNFVWCGGFDNQTGSADFSPCFRPLQCAARPEGEFWKGDDWREFRKSVTDGTFRYCQKNQCANIVAGWLPKKADYKDGWMGEILDGDLSVIPPIEELHFSYDGHCNLKCPSCRTEIQTNTREQNENLDIMYEKNLKPYMEKARHLTLSGCGEAMISPHSKKVLQSFSKESNPDLVVELRTNATTVNPKSWEALGTGKDVIRHITVSIDASTKESFEKVRYPAKWEIVLKNLKFIQFLRNSGAIDMFEFHVVIQSENINQLLDIAKMAINYDADAVTYSRLINWREMSEEEYHEVNPFWYDHPLHDNLMRELKALEKFRNAIETDQCDLTRGRKKMYINIHFSPDPNSSYDIIRKGRFKIR